MITDLPPKAAALTEREILSRLEESLRECADYAYQLSIGKRGPIYKKFMQSMKLAEGCCRQMSAWREDTRWLPFGIKIGLAQERCGRWLREKHGPAAFAKLAEILRQARYEASKLEHDKTGRAGAILPEEQAAPTRTQGRPVSMSGLILPPSYTETMH